MKFRSYLVYCGSFVLCSLVDGYMAVCFWLNQHYRLYYMVTVATWLGLIIAWLGFGAVSPFVAIFLVPILTVVLWILSIPYIAAILVIGS